MLIQYPLDTPRLRLEPFQATDGDALYVMERDPQVKRYAGGVTTRTQSDKLLQRFIASVRDTGFGPVAIKLRATNKRREDEIVGLCGFYGTDIPGEAEIFYGLARHAWGQGYATEACRAFVAAGVEQMGLTRIIAPVHPENLRSIRVLEKIGLTFSHVTTDSMYADSMYADSMYADSMYADSMYAVAHVYCLTR